MHSRGMRWRARAWAAVWPLLAEVSLVEDEIDYHMSVAWNGGDAAYSLDLDTGTWTALTSANGPGKANETGTFKRWRYVGDSSFVLVNGPKQNAFLFRL